MQFYLHSLTAKIHVFLKRNSLSLICAAYIVLDVRPSTEAWRTYLGPHPKENDILSSTSYQLPLPPDVGMRLCCPISSLCVRILPGLILHRSCAYHKATVSSCVQCPLVYGKHCHRVVACFLYLLQSFLLLFFHYPWSLTLGRNGYDTDTLFKPQKFTGSFVVVLWPVVSFHVNCHLQTNKKLLWWKLKDVLWYLVSHYEFV